MESINCSCKDRRCVSSGIGKKNGVRMIIGRYNCPRHGLYEETLYTRQVCCERSNDQIYTYQPEEDFDF